MREQDDIRFAVCVNNDGYPASLELQKIYRILPDQAAEAGKDLRIVDESGEDYLYPSWRFVPVNGPPEIGRSFLRRRG